jgi:hypothetical protein
MINAIVIRSDKILKGLSWFINVKAITIYPFIIIKENVNGYDFKRTMSHEKIHYNQQESLLIIPFYILYGIEYIYRILKHGKKDAYRNISFERECYKNETDFNYHYTRCSFGWIKHLKK